ncbi:MAG TPA: hypothetical protein VN802_22100 [Stellaceae bacterium]|nr:hypothetical protein [Stellaceae bacterium]
MGNDRDDGQPRHPVAEPEILPPERADPRRRGADGVWVTHQRVFIAPPGPLGMVLGLIAMAALAALGVLAFLGFFLILIPALGVMVAAIVLAALFRGARRT